MLSAGFAAQYITPPVGKEIPGLFERRFAEGTHDDLYARAVVVDDGCRCAALVQVDAIFVRDELVQAARAEAERRCGIPGGNCLIAATHTHSGGPVFRGFLSENDPEYETFLVKQTGAAIAEAYERRRPALVAAGAGEVGDVAFNRRFFMKDGRQRTHPGKMNADIAEPAGPEDPTVTVVGFRGPDDDEPFGCIVSFACHGTHMNGLLYSADYMKWVVDTLGAVYGPDFGVVFLNGACGDVTQVDNRSERPMEFGPAWCRRTGRAVGAEAVKQLVLMMIGFAEATVDTATTVVEAAIRAASDEAVQAARAYLAGDHTQQGPVVFADALFEEEAGVAQQNKREPVDVEAIFAQGLLDVEALRRDRPTRSLEVQGIRIGDTLFWSVPGELFQAYALDVRKQSPFAHTCCVELANGYAGYICTPDAFAGGGYEVRTAHSSLLDKHAGARIVQAAIDVAESLHATLESA